MTKSIFQINLPIYFPSLSINNILIFKTWLINYVCFCRTPVYYRDLTSHVTISDSAIKPTKYTIFGLIIMFLTNARYTVFVLILVVLYEMRRFRQHVKTWIRVGIIWWKIVEYVDEYFTWTQSHLMFYIIVSCIKWWTK